MSGEMDTIMQNLVRVGIVSSVDAAKHQARVIFPDKNMVSGSLHVLQTSAEWMPKVNDTVLCLYLPIFNGDGFVIGGIS